MYRALRLVSAAAAIGLVLLTIVLAAPAGRLAATVAGVLVLTSPEVLAASHIAKPHALAACTALAALVVAERTLWRRPALVGLLAGAACGMSVVYAAMVAGFALMAAWRRGVRAGFVLLGVAAAVAIITNAPLLLHLQRFVTTVADQQTDYGYGSVSLGHLAAYVEELWALGLGPAGLLLAAIGVSGAGLAPLALRLAALWAITAFGLGIGTLRIGLMVVPLGAALAGHGAAWLHDHLRGATLRTILCTILVMLQTGKLGTFTGLAAAYANDACGHGTAIRAGRWINANLPAGARVAVDDSPEWTDLVPPFDLLRVRPTPAPDPDADYVIVTDKCPARLAPRLVDAGARGFVPLATFDSCLATPLGGLCNCRYQVNLAVGVLGRAPRRPS